MSAGVMRPPLATTLKNPCEPFTGILVFWAKAVPQEV